MIELLKKVKSYIEDAEIDRDGEWGEGRTIDKLIKDNAMPPVYNEVISEIQTRESNKEMLMAKYGPKVTRPKGFK